MEGPSPAARILAPASLCGQAVTAFEQRLGLPEPAQFAGSWRWRFLVTLYCPLEHQTHHVLDRNACPDAVAIAGDERPVLDVALRALDEHTRRPFLQWNRLRLGDTRKRRWPDPRLGTAHQHQATTIGLGAPKTRE